MRNKILTAVTKIINLSIETSVFPSIYKHSKIIPLKKKPSLIDINCSSYRPVNLLPIPGKIVEKAVFNQLVKYLEENKLLHPNHHEGRKGHSTTTALVQMYNNWVENMEEGKLVGVMMIDQSAAFDLCDHQLLLEKLKLMGIQTEAACWMESYLRGRSQSTMVDGHLSSEQLLPPCSVIQGGIGSGLLYLVYTNDLPDVIHSHSVNYQEPKSHCQEDGSMVNFVDDGTVYVANKNPVIVSQKLTEHYTKIEQYIYSNKLVINSDKTHLLVMAGRGAIAARRMEVQVQAGPDVIDQSISEKLLGGTIHFTGRWNEMVKNCSSSTISQLAGILNGLKKLHQADRADQAEFSRSSFKYRAQRYYNRIPADLKRLTLEVFKSRLKQYTKSNIPIK